MLMRLLAFLLVAAVILSVARALTIVLILAVVALLVWALITRPLEMLGLAFLGLLSGALQSRPTTTIMCVAGIAALTSLRSSSDPSPKKPADPETHA